MPDLQRYDTPESVMRAALELARQGIGSVEPNPAVGAVLVNEQLEHLASGWHERFGGPHAEVNAFADLERRVPDADERRRLLSTATLFVTLEPCCHHGKTPPCSQAVIAAGIPRVVIAMSDPFPKVAGGGINELISAGVSVTVGLLQEEAQLLNAPFLKLVTRGLPYVHAKWAMSWDGKIATHAGDSQWISNERSRAIVHQLRGRMDAIVVGIGTALADDPLLTARPPGPRTAVRVVLDSAARLPLTSQLVLTKQDAPVLVATTANAPVERVDALRQCGVEVLVLPTDSPFSPRPSLTALLREFGRRRLTNVLIEGGAGLLGSCFDEQLIDEAHVFVAPKLIGGTQAPGPIGGRGADRVNLASLLDQVSMTPCGDDIYLRGRIRSREAGEL